MKFLFSIGFIVCFHTLSAQLLPKERIAGEWVCQEVTVLNDSTMGMTDEEAKLMSQMTKDLFTGCTFILGADNILRLKEPRQPSKQWSETQKMLDGKSWTLDPKTMSVQIGGRENIMDFHVREKNGDTFFIMSDVPVTLKMKRK